VFEILEAFHAKYCTKKAAQDFCADARVLVYGPRC